MNFISDEKLISNFAQQIPVEWLEVGACCGIYAI